MVIDATESAGTAAGVTSFLPTSRDCSFPAHVFSFW